VKLTVIDNYGCKSYCKLNVTVLNRPPFVDAGLDLTGCVYEPIPLCGIAYDRDGFISLYEWDFDGDGDFDWAARTTANTTVFYEKPGLYIATLKVTDDWGNTSTDSINVTIYAVMNQPPIADAGKDQRVAPGTVTLAGAGSDPDGMIILYEWDFNGDNIFDWSSTYTGVVNHTYTEEGVYTATLRVTDNDYAYALDSVNIEVNLSVVIENVSAEIFIDWNHGYNYTIVFNRTVNYDNVSVVIYEPGGPQVVFTRDTGLLVHAPNRYTVSSPPAVTPKTGHTIGIQVFYYETLVGARVIEVINGSMEEPIPLEEYNAVYEIQYELHEETDNEINELNITGIANITRKYELCHMEFQATGMFFMESYEDDTTMIIDCIITNFQGNTTKREGAVVHEGMKMVGYGKLEVTEEDVRIDADIIEFRTAEENGNTTEEYVYCEGIMIYEGTPIDMRGEITIERELIGRGVHDNYAGISYDCLIIKTEMTMRSKTPPAAGSQPFYMYNRTITWEVIGDMYENRTIYYEYYELRMIGYDETETNGSVYVAGNPTIEAEEELHITTVTDLEGVAPLIMVGEDKLILRSPYDFTVEYTVVGMENIYIEEQEFTCVHIYGSVIHNGSGETHAWIVCTDAFKGTPVKLTINYKWRNETEKWNIKLLKLY
jgi:hypothetical protein